MCQSAPGCDGKGRTCLAGRSRGRTVPAMTDHDPAVDVADDADVDPGGPAALRSLPPELRQLVRVVAQARDADDDADADPRRLWERLSVAADAVWRAAAQPAPDRLPGTAIDPVRDALDRAWLAPETRRAIEAAAASAVNIALDRVAPQLELGALLLDLDRCEHGRHRADTCHGCPGGRSAGNTHAPPGARIGTTIDGRPIVVPADRADRHAWRAWAPSGPS